MISVDFVGGAAYDTVDDQAVVTVAMPSHPPPTPTVDYVYLAFWSGRVSSGHTATGMQYLYARSEFGQNLAGVMWSRLTLDAYTQFGPAAPLVLTRTRVATTLPLTPTYAGGVSVRILAYRVTRTLVDGFNTAVGYQADAFLGIGIGAVDGSTVWSGLVRPQFVAPSFPFTEEQLFHAEPSPVLQHYALAFFDIITVPFWRAGEYPPGNPDNIQPFYDGVPTSGCTIDDPVPALGQPPLTRRYAPSQPYFGNVVWDSLGWGLQPGQWPLENTATIHTPGPIHQIVSFGDPHDVADPPIVAFVTQYDPVLFAGHLLITETLVPYPDQPPPVVVPQFCPDNGVALAAGPAARVRTEAPVTIRAELAGRQPASVTAVVR